MTRLIRPALLVALAATSGCAGLLDPITVEDLPEPPPEAEGPLDLALTCFPPEDSDDGIGGTGCPPL